MRRLSIAVIAAASTIALTQIASAADLPVKAAPAPLPPPPVISWTGWYVGLNAGGTWGGRNSVDVVSSAVQDFTALAGDGSYASNSAAGATGSVGGGRNGGFIGGGQIGYNWQFSPAWVLGFEADIQGIANNKGDGVLNTQTGGFPWILANEIIDTEIRTSKRLRYLGTLRGRLGWLATPTVLVYGTGGLAYGGVKASTSIIQSNNDCQQFPGACIQTTASTSGSYSKTRAGWTAGGGVAWKFAQNWSANVEYLYYDLGKVTYSNGQLVFNNGTLPGAGGPSVVDSQSTIRFDGHIARFGVNYHF